MLGVMLKVGDKKGDVRVTKVIFVVDSVDLCVWLCIWRVAIS